MNARTRAMAAVGGILVLALCGAIAARAARSVGFNETDPQTTVTHFTNGMGTQMTKLSIKNTWTNESGDTALSDIAPNPALLYWDNNLYANSDYVAGTDSSTTGHVNWTDRDILHNGANLKFKVTLVMKDSGGNDHNVTSEEIIRSCEN